MILTRKTDVIAPFCPALQTLGSVGLASQHGSLGSPFLTAPLLFYKRYPSLSPGSRHRNVPVKIDTRSDKQQPQNREKYGRRSA